MKIVITISDENGGLQLKKGKEAKSSKLLVMGGSFWVDLGQFDDGACKEVVLLGDTWGDGKVLTKAVLGVTYAGETKRKTFNPATGRVETEDQAKKA